MRYGSDLGETRSGDDGTIFTKHRFCLATKNLMIMENMELEICVFYLPLQCTLVQNSKRGPVTENVHKQKRLSEPSHLRNGIRTWHPYMGTISGPISHPYKGPLMKKRVDRLNKLDQMHQAL